MDPDEIKKICCHKKGFCLLRKLYNMKQQSNTNATKSEADPFKQQFHLKISIYQGSTVA